ncbi:MAG: DUF924 family protein [Pseudomonadota bacterium]
MSDYQTVLDFWFKELTEKQWWVKDEALDQSICERFGELHQAATQAELSNWRETPEGRLAEVIVLDQFSRNIYRDTSQSFAFDGIALVLAQEAIRVNADKALMPTQRAFLYMPFMHSESVLVHETAIKLFGEPEMKDNYDFERRHKAIIDRFGRYPHRNAILGRASTPEEIAFLEEPGSSF